MLVKYNIQVLIKETTSETAAEIWQGTGSVTLGMEIAPFSWYATTDQIFIDAQAFDWPVNIVGGSVHGAVIACAFKSTVASAVLTGL